MEEPVQKIKEELKEKNEVLTEQINQNKALKRHLNHLNQQYKETKLHLSELDQSLKKDSLKIYFKGYSDT